MSKPSEAGPIEIYSEGVMWCHQHIDAHIKFFVANEQGIMNIPLHYVWFRLIAIIGPIADITDRSKQKDAFALASTDLPNSKVTGFIIHIHFWSLFFLNSSAKIGYSLGRLYVRGK